MSKREEIENRVWDMMQPLLKEMSLIGVDAEYVKEGGEYFLRCYIDRDGGVGITECEAFSRAIDPLLDEEDFIPDAYTLEVSSPGLCRVLKSRRDFEYAAGREVELHFYQAVEGKKTLRGILTEADAKNVTIQKEDETLCFSRTQISRINLAFDF